MTKYIEHSLSQDKMHIIMPNTEQLMREQAMTEVQRLGQEIEATQRTWIPLTDSEKNKMAFIAGSDKHWLIRLVENKLKEKNETT